MNRVFLKITPRSFSEAMRLCKRKKPTRKMKTIIPICRDKKTRPELRPTNNDALLLFSESLNNNNIKNRVQLRLSKKVASDRGLIPKEK